MRTQIKDRITVIRHDPIILREGVVLSSGFKIFTSFFAKIVRNDNAELIIDSNFVVINFDRFIDLTQGHVDLYQNHITLIVRIGIQFPNELKLIRLDIEVFVHFVSRKKNIE